jgi:predicted ester cyclase
VLEHFEEFVNGQDLAAIDRNMAEDFFDHDGPEGRPTGWAGDKAMMAAMYKTFPDLHVEIKDVIAEGDKVVVRNVWTGTHSETGERMEFHGFVLWRFANGKIAERWATVTAPRPLRSRDVQW